MSSKHKERDRERDRERGADRERSKSRGKERSDKKKDRRDKSRDRESRSTKERSERRRTSRDCSRDESSQARTEQRRSRSRDRERRRRRSSRSRSKERPTASRERDAGGERSERRRERDQHMQQQQQLSSQHQQHRGGTSSGRSSEQRQPSPPLVDDELLQLQMVQSLIKEEPTSLTQVFLEAVAAATASANVALAGTRSKNLAEMFNCVNSADDGLVENPFTSMLTPYQQQLQLQQQLQQHQQQQLLIQQQQHQQQLLLQQQQQQRRQSPAKPLTTSTSSTEQLNSASNSGAEQRVKKKKSRWGGSENDKTFIPGMPTILPASLDSHQQEAYLVQLQIEEISRKLRTGDLTIARDEERSPSPEPIYSSDGKRLNTREFRTRKRLEEQRHQLVVRMQCMNPEFKPPADYKPPVVRVSDKVLIPQEEHPDINFVGLLIGPRGNTLKAMEKDTGAKIIIRGKGSVKEGKVGRKDGQPLPGEDEPLHAFITAANPECVKKAVDKIKDVIRQGIEVPEGHNDLRRMQLRELAQLNGTLRETDGPRCTNCGSTEHKSWLCPDKPNITNNIVCSACGGAGHIAKDCRSKRPGAGGPPCADAQAKIDEEYLSLMAELGEGPPPKQKEVDPLVQAQLSRGNYSLFDRPSGAPRAIQAASSSSSSSHGGGGGHGHHHGHHHNQHQNHHNHHHQQQQSHHQHHSQHHQQASAWQQQQHQQQQQQQQNQQPTPPPGPPGPPPLLGWMQSHQPPPPGQDGMPQPPMPPGSAAMPLPPGTGSQSNGTSVTGALPPWGNAVASASMIVHPPPPPQFPWGGAPPQFIPPPPPGPPPPPSGVSSSGIPGLLAPPPPPPPN